MDQTIAFVWENFGPLHVDRCEAVRRRGFRVVGIELASQSNTYEWLPTQTEFEKITLFSGGTSDDFDEVALFRALAPVCYRTRARHVFLCHYIKPSIFASAVAMRVLGRRVYTMNDSKFDDVPRNLSREMLKRLLFLPYHGCLAASTRSQDYARFLGIRKERIVPGYDTISVRRMKEGLACGGSAAASFHDRHFTIIARLVPKKNHRIALDAYRLYVSGNANPRRLVICGSGPLEEELRAQARSLSLESFVSFTGFVQTNEVSRILGSTLALILPSTEEQFGQVVLEAIAAGVPALVSEASGARDELVRSGVNGFVFEPDNREGLAWFMSVLSRDEQLWLQMVEATKRFVPFSDVERFADGVERLISISSA